MKRTVSFGRCPATNDIYLVNKDDNGFVSVWAWLEENNACEEDSTSSRIIVPCCAIDFDGSDITNIFGSEQYLGNKLYPMWETWTEVDEKYNGNENIVDAVMGDIDINDSVVIETSRKFGDTMSDLNPGYYIVATLS